MIEHAYVDTSWLIAIAFAEQGAAALRRRLEKFTHIYSANLLEAELLAAFRREQVEARLAALDRITWIIPDRPLHEEIKAVLSAGYVRGADCWHLASALFLAGDAGDLTFLTLDSKQRTVAQLLGFQ